ncbi:hypothetical protein ACFY2C_41940, partial [Streptomyces sp. NPDC001435]
DATGPGTAWIRRLHAGDRLTVRAGRHRPPGESGTRRLYLGDGCALGTLDAFARSGEAPVVAMEVPADAVDPSPTAGPATASCPRHKRRVTQCSPGSNEPLKKVS